MENNRKQDRKILKWVLWSIAMILVGSFTTKIMDRNEPSLFYVSGHGWDKLELVLRQVEQNYVDQLDYDKITERLLPVILKELDPHSIYLPPQELKEADSDLSGNFEGIGITFNIPEDTAMVITVISGGPSQKAGLNTGDKIITVNGENVAGVKFNQDSLVSRMRGPKGTKVKLGILRDGHMVDFDIIRDKIPVNSVDVAYMVNDTTGYIKLSKFSRNTYREVYKALGELKDAGMTRLVLDLQDNTGGYLDQALRVCNEFLPKDAMIVYMYGEHRDRQEFKASGHGQYQDIELCILINEISASSSEIVAGAMQDNDRATIFGRRSFGKGMVQEPIYFSDNSGLRLTVARFYTASGRCVQKPYTEGSDDYLQDIYDRYLHGEMTSVDSIPVNDSLKYFTVSGKTVYGGGGIIPDVFVPVDTTGVSDMLVDINRRALSVKYSAAVAERYRKELRNIDTFDGLDAFFAAHDKDITDDFIRYIESQGVTYSAEDWDISGDIILTQLHALIGRYTPLEDAGFYPYFNRIDKVFNTAVRQ